MKISESCAACLFDKQRKRTNDPDYLSRIRELLEKRSEEDTAPYMVWKFDRLYRDYFGRETDYQRIKKESNDLVLEMEDALRREIRLAPDPLARAVVMDRIGNYIDYGAMDQIDKETFLDLFRKVEMSEGDKKTYAAFLRACSEGRSFLLVCDNCGEIVLDRLLLEQLSLRFPHLTFYALLRGGNVLNDATAEDAVYTGLDRIAEIIPSGAAAAGTIPALMSDKALQILGHADVILAKGQGNYESLSGQGYHVFYSFLCKCWHFTERFHVPELTGLFIEE